MHEVPQRQHEWLQRLVGEWTSLTEATMEPGKPPQTFEGTEHVRSLGGLWILGEGQGDMPGGGRATTLITLGYDPRRQRFVGTFVGSMMTHLWVYDGELDAAGRVLALDTEGPSMAGDGRIVKYRDVVEVHSADHRTLSAYVMGDDGTWRPIMTATYRRRT
jgi:hypothetical protein